MKYLLTLAITTLMSFQVMAADLKDKDVSQWINAMTALAPWLDTHEEKFIANISEPNNPEVAFKESVNAIKKAGLYDELNGKVQKLGFKNVEEWSDTTQKVTFAWMALQIDTNKSQIQDAKVKYEEMKASPSIPESQKAIMEQMMAPALAMLELAKNASDADKAAVQPHQKTLLTFFEHDQK